MGELTQKELKELLHYDPLSGIFTWLERPANMFSHCKSPKHKCDVWNTNFSNKQAGAKWKGTKSKTSYISITITIKGRTRRYRAHRLAFLYMTGKFPEDQVDHIDQNGLNNKWINLRKASQTENSKNKPIYSNNTSGCAGVNWHKSTKRWHVRINVAGERICGGFFINKDEATVKRKQLELEHGYHKNHGSKDKKNSQK